MIGKPKDRRMRVVYAAGPGDVLNTFAQWREGQRDATQVSKTYSGQFFEVCREMGAEALVIASHGPRAEVKEGAFTIRHRPILLQGHGAVLYHVGQFWYGVKLSWAVLRFGAKVLVVAEGTQWPVLAPLGWLGIKVIPSLHCTFWAAGYPARSRLQRMLLRGYGWFWRHVAAATLCVSPECERQVRELAGEPRGPVYQARAQYEREFFAGLPEPEYTQRPFGVLFTGRVERSKGVFELVEMAQRLEAQGTGRFRWEICGAGGALAELREAVRQAGLEGVMTLRGYCNREAMFEAYGRCHAVVVPTTGKFAEGLNRSAVEGVLAGRPVVTSRLANARGVLGEGLVIVPPGDVGAYCGALERLAKEQEYYRARRRGGVEVREQFYDGQRSWGAALRRALREVCGVGVEEAREGEEMENKEGVRVEPAGR